jgi:hypothetical protein
MKEETAGKWTPERVRKELPIVRLQLHPRGGVVEAFVTGEAHHQYATVTADLGTYACGWPFTWSAIASALNHNQPLRT